VIRFLVDHNFDEDYLRAAKRRAEREGAKLHFDLARQVELDRARDDRVLEWAAEKGAVVLTHDRNTLIGHAHRRVRAGLRMAGVAVVDGHASEAVVASDIVLLAVATTQEEWEGQVIYLPLRA
jgi:hypothetical protein